MRSRAISESDTWAAAVTLALSSSPTSATAATRAYFSLKFMARHSARETRGAAGGGAAWVSDAAALCMCAAAAALALLRSFLRAFATEKTSNVKMLSEAFHLV